MNSKTNKYKEIEEVRKSSRRKEEDKDQILGKRLGEKSEHL